MKPIHVVIVGGGPAGLTAAYQLSKAGITSVVLEKDQVVGGIARTVNHRGYRFDIGGHRFFTKVQAVDDMWREVLSDGDFLHRPRLSRIFYKKTFFHYPLRPANALWGAGLWNSVLILLSYLKARLFPRKPEVTFEQWVINRFGERLYRMFFKTYTEKVWGIPGNEISAEWAAQRIVGLSLLRAVKNALFPPRSSGTTSKKASGIKTLAEAFDYPRLGPGMMWETVASQIQQQGHPVRLGACVERIVWTENRIEAMEIQIDGRTERVEGTDFISSMPLSELIEKFSPPAPDPVRKAAAGLNYRDFLVVALIINKREVFQDNWLYIHEPDVKVGRIQNFKNWSPDMVPDPEKTCLGLEYFCFENDNLWTLPDEQLIALATKELTQIGLVQAADVIEGAVVRMPKAYPVYDATYREHLHVIRQFLATVENLQVVGRNGMHHYNNQDHSMLTAMLAVKNLLGANFDLWSVNTDQEHHEEITKGTRSPVADAALLAVTQPRTPKVIPRVPPS
jgi:protoporphyrinogen oxidase